MTDEPTSPESEPTPPEGAAEPAEREPTPAERAACEAARAARKARKAQEKADRLAAEYARLAGPQAEPVSLDEPAPETPADEQAHGSRTAVLTVAAALVACLAFLVVAIVVHVSNGDKTGSGQLTPALRDQVLLSARQDVVVLNSLDYHDIDAGLARWRDASTGALRTSFDHVTAAARKRIADAKAVTTARILEAAVVSLDPADGQAQVIASVELTVTPSSGKAVVKRERQQADLSRVGDGWKISGLQQVGVTVR
jgi:Mce-associated membrane protein